MRVLLLIIVIAFSVQEGFAQTIFFGNPKQKVSSQSSASHVMAPDEFKTAVQNFHQQVQTKIVNEVNQEMKNRPPVKSGALPASSASSNALPSQPQSSSSSAQPHTIPNPPASSTYSISNTPNTETQVGTPTATPNNNQDAIYSGFGTGNNNPSSQPSTQAPNSSGTSSGWNVRY